MTEDPIDPVIARAAETLAQQLNEATTKHTLWFIAETNSGSVVWCSICGSCIWSPDNGKIKVNRPKQTSGRCDGSPVTEDEVIKAKY